MNSSDYPQFSTPVKAKRALNLNSDPNPLPVSKTPEKRPYELPNRARNRGVALSIKEIRRVAQARPQQQTDQIKSVSKQVSCWPSESPPPKTPGDAPSKLPQKYEILCEFFNSLDSSIRLLRMKGSMTSFTNISTKIECLTDRRFSHAHLAQMKHILPEAIEIKRVLKFDERTSCMKPDLQININADAIECEGNSKSEDKKINLRKLFRSRLADFHKAHPEDDVDVPEEDLPEPFNRSKQALETNIMKAPTSSSPSVPATRTPAEQQRGDAANMERKPQQLPLVASHFSPSFEKRFSKRKSSKASIQSSVFQVTEPCPDKISSEEETTSSSATSSLKLSSKPFTTEKYLASSSSSPADSLLSCPPATPIKAIDTTESTDDSPAKLGNKLSTPAKLASTPASLMAATPTLQPPKRRYMSPDDASSSSPNKLVRRPLRSKSLKFDSPVKNVKADKFVHEIEEKSVNEDNVLRILPESLLQSIREKEKKAMEERDPAISRAKRRKQMIACLPKIFNLIHYLFQSIQRSVITKEELIQKITAGHTAITDRKEVEEQLSLLLELVPEWISEKLASCGDLLIQINKMSSPESIRAQLQEAK